jgi:tetratricopeptide (TPR) repeat protein
VERELTAGQRLLRQGRWDEAEEALAKAAEQAPEYAWPHLYLALARADAGRTEEALPAIDRALALIPGSAVLPVFRGRILCDAGRAEEALAALQEGLDRDPRYIVARGYQALALMQRGDVAAAQERWSATLEEPPSALLGRMLLAAERFAAGSSVGQAVSLPVEAPGPAAGLPVDVAAEADNLPDDVPGSPDSMPGADDRQAISLPHRDRRKAGAALKRARRAYLKERLADARASYEEAVQADPGAAEAWLEFAVANFELDAYEAAKEALERYLQAAELDETDPHYRAYRAGCEACLGNAEEALEWLEGADARQPVTPYARGRALLALDRIPEARHAFIQYVGMVPRVAQARIKAVMGGK